MSGIRSRNSRYRRFTSSLEPDGGATGSAMTAAGAGGGADAASMNPRPVRHNGRPVVPPGPVPREPVTSAAGAAA